MDQLETLLAMPPRERFYQLRQLYIDGKTEIVSAVGRELAKRRKEVVGDWEEAKRVIDLTPEPNVTSTADGKPYINVMLPNIKGYPCQYVRYLSKGGRKSWLVIFNGHTNEAHRRDFSVISVKEAKAVFR